MKSSEGVKTPERKTIMASGRSNVPEKTELASQAQMKRN
jgi:hypothetical protein